MWNCGWMELWREHAGELWPSNAQSLRVEDESIYCIASVIRHLRSSYAKSLYLLVYFIFLFLDKLLLVNSLGVSITNPNHVQDDSQPTPFQALNTKDSKLPTPLCAVTQPRGFKSRTHLKQAYHLLAPPASRAAAPTPLELLLGVHQA
jgi:hypothetical protein